MVLCAGKSSLGKVCSADQMIERLNKLFLFLLGQEIAYFPAFSAVYKGNGFSIPRVDGALNMYFGEEALPSHYFCRRFNTRL